MTKLIINADDLGLSKGVNQGILYAYKNGVVNSASLMTTTDYFEDAVEIVHEYKLKNIGLHFNLTEGRSAIKTHKTICDEDNNFDRNVYLKNNIDLDEVYEELEMQYLIAINRGVTINHFDSHHHIHMTHKFRKVFVALSKKYKIPLRRINNTARNPIKVFKFLYDTNHVKYYTKEFSAGFYDKTATINNFLKIIEQYKGCDLEIMCHPGYSDLKNGIYNLAREKELEVLCSNEVVTRLKEQ